MNTDSSNSNGDKTTDEKVWRLVDAINKAKAEINKLKGSGGEAGEGIIAESFTQQAILDALPAQVAVLDGEGKILAVNKSWKRFAVESSLRSPSYAVGVNYLQVCRSARGEGAETAMLAAEGILKVLRNETNEFALEYPCHSGNQQRWFHLAVAPLGNAPGHGAVAIHVNITQRKLAEIALRAREEHLGAILRSEPECVKVVSLEGLLLEVNPAGLKMLEAESLDAVKGASVVDFVFPQDRSLFLDLHAKSRAGETNQAIFRLVTANGNLRWVESHSTPLLNEKREITAILSVTREITQRIQSEQRIHRLNRLYSVSSSINHAIVRIKDLNQLFVEACRIAVESGGLLMAWVGVSDAEGILQPVARFGHDVGYLDTVTVTTRSDLKSGRGPGGAAFRTGQTAWLNDIEEDRDTFASREEALVRGYRSCAAFPLKRGVDTIGVFVVYSGTVDYFNEEELSVLNALADNLSFAIESHDHEKLRRQAESDLRASQANLAIAQRIAHFGSWQIDLPPSGDFDQGKLHWSDEMFRIAGFEPGAIEVTNRLFFSLVPVEDHSRIRGAIVEAAHNRREYAIEHALIRANGERRIIREIGQFFYDNLGRPDCVVGTAHDVTDAKKADEALRFNAHLLNVAQEAILVRDSSGSIVYWNKGAERTYGWTADEALGKNPVGLLQADSAHYELASSAVRNFGQWQGEMVERTKRGDKITVEARWTSVSREDGLQNSVLMISTDITEKKKLEAQFLRAQRMESIGTLAGGVAHDLNNILAPILMSVDLMQSQITDGEMRQLLATIQVSAQRGADLVRQVLSFARGVEGQRMTINVFHLLREIQKIIRDTFPKGISINLDASRDLASIVGDPTQLHQVLMNLCVNARDAMPHGGRLSLSAENIVLDDVFAALNPGSVPGTYVVIVVADTGSGMTNAVKDRIFEPFFTTKEIGRGTGLGLSTSLGIVKSHGGFISVYSEPNQGSTFKVYLPAGGKSDPFPEGDAAKDLPLGSGETVLVVDDEENVRIIARKTLERHGYRVLLAGHGAEALAIYVQRQRDIAVVITDMAMPIMDGAATIIALKSVNSDVKIIGSSGLASNSSVAKAIHAGAHLFIPKPYTAEALLKIIHQALKPSSPGSGTFSANPTGDAKA